MENPFFNFFKPVFDYIDSGALFRNPFRWLYMIIAVGNLLFPLFLLIMMISNDGFSGMPGKVVVLIILIFLILFAAAWFSFQLWWNRQAKVANVTATSDEFVVTPVFTHFIQTFGEWLGCYIAIVGTLVAIFGTLFGAGHLPIDQLGFVDLSIAGIILMPVYGFIIICVFRFIAEQARALVTVANNTRK